MEAHVQVVPVVLPALAGALIASVWQALLLTGAVAAVMHTMRDITPSGRTWVWRALLVVVLLLPVLPWLFPHAPVAGHRGIHAGQGWSLALLGVWAVCSGWRAWRSARDAVRLGRLSRRAVPVAVGGAVGALLTGDRRVELCVSSEIDRPGMMGFLRPRVLLPEGLMETLSAAELEHVVRHEMEHLRRGDDWFNLLQEIGLVLFPLNPALLWLDRRLCRERELACDDGVLQATHAERAYAACLVKLAEDSLHRKGVAFALSVLGSAFVSGLRCGGRESELVGRVRRILAGPDRGEPGMRVRLAAGALTMATVAGAVVLAGSPQWVSFDGVPVAVAGAVRASAFEPVAASGQMQPVVLASSREAGAPVLARAAVGRLGVARVHTASLRISRRRAGPRMLPVNEIVEAPKTAIGVPAMRNAAMYGEDRNGARLVVTEFEVSQPMYAAVPWGSGWLIVQL